MSRTAPINSAKPPNQQRSTDRKMENLHEQIEMEMHEQIKQRAYQLYEERGRAHGHHEEDWARAEREIRELGKLRRAA